MVVRFWGTRGSIAKAGRGTVRYGGNTSCVEVRSAAGTLAILDCGTGAHGLGQALARESGPLRGHILITHTHWDHIQGLPFFLPLFQPETEWDIYAPRGLGDSIQTTLAGQMQYTYFPVTLEQLAATIRYHDLVEGAFTVGDIHVTAQYLNHPALTLGYRLEADGVGVVYATDHEPHSRRLATAETSDDDRSERRHADFLHGADLVIHDAQYMADEYPAKAGWGHSTAEYAVETARRAGVRRLALFHHDPARDDDAIDRMVEAARTRAAAVESGLEVFAAAEGQVLYLGGRATREPPSPRRGRADAPPALASGSVLVAVSEPATAVLLSDAVKADGLQLFVADEAAAVLETVERERPALVILQHRRGQGDGLAVCREIRALPEHGGEVPILVVGDRDGSRPETADADPASDWLVPPFSPNYARTMIRAWVLRRACRWKPAPHGEDEAERLRALRALGVLDTESEERFDRLTRVAAATFDVPIALVSLVDEDRQWFKSCYGLDARQTDRESAFCAHAILRDDAMIVPDTLLDERFADNPLVTGEPYVRFYAGHPLSLQDGHRVGTLCLIDHRPRELDDSAVRLLRDIAQLVQRELRATADAEAEADPAAT